MLLTAQAQSNQVLSVQQSVLGATTSAELCIIGDGAAALAAGCMLSPKGDAIKVLVPADSTKKAGDLTAVKYATSLKLPAEFETRPAGIGSSNRRSRVNFQVVTGNSEDALLGIETLVIAASATEYGAITRKLAGSFRNGQTVYLVNAPLAGGLQFAAQLEAIDPELQLNILELGKLFDSASIEGNVLIIAGARDKVTVCGNSRNETRRGLSVASSLSEELVPASNLMERGLSDIERILRPTLLLFALLGARGRELDCISNIVNPSLTALVTALEGEIKSLSRVFKCVSHSFLETLTDFAGTSFEDADCLDQALIVVARNMFNENNGADQAMSVTAAMSLLSEDVCETLVLLSEFARLSRVATPVVNSIVDLAQATTKCDLRKQGRSLTDLGLVGFDVAEIVELINS